MPEVVIGALRVWHRHEDEPRSSSTIQEELHALEEQLGFHANLARPTERNLLRNSAQYWAAQGLIEPISGLVRLTPLGRDLAETKIVRSDFAAVTIRTFTLPNETAYDEGERTVWRDAGLKIHPFELILRVLLALESQAGRPEGHLISSEVGRVLIPLAGIKANSEEIARTILNVRRGGQTLEGWDPGAPSDKDKRLVREFLIFLEAYGYLRRVNEDAKPDRHKETDAYEIPAESRFAVADLLRVAILTDNMSNLISTVISSGAPEEVERRRIWAQTLSRPKQALFRQRVKEQQERCLITGTDVAHVLEAAHIKPVASRGSDDPSNGFLLRADIHLLFDSSHLKISPEGRVEVDRSTSRPPYNSLPGHIDLPASVNIDLVKWRYDLL